MSDLFSETHAIEQSPRCVHGQRMSPHTATTGHNINQASLLFEIFGCCPAAVFDLTVFSLLFCLCGQAFPQSKLLCSNRSLALARNNYKDFLRHLLINQ